MDKSMCLHGISVCSICILCLLPHRFVATHLFFAQIVVADIQDHAPHLTSLRGLGDDLTANHRHQPGADVIVGQVDSAGKFSKLYSVLQYFIVQ